MNVNNNLSANMLYASYSVAQMQRSESNGTQTNSFELSSFSFSSNSFELQSTLDQDPFEAEYAKFQDFLQGIGYEGKPISELSQEEATKLVGDDGFFGIDQTAQRIADFVIMGSGGDEKLMREGREGIMQGFKDAEATWGGKLPDISYATIEKAAKMIDDKMAELGYSVLDTSA